MEKKYDIIEQTEENLDLIPKTEIIGGGDDMRTMFEIVNINNIDAFDRFNMIQVDDGLLLKNETSSKDGLQGELKGYYISEFTSIDRETGVAMDRYYTLLFIDDQTYISLSYSIVNQLKTLHKFFGRPSEWEKGLKVKISQKVRNEKTGYVIKVDR